MTRQTEETIKLMFAAAAVIAAAVWYVSRFM